MSVQILEDSFSPDNATRENATAQLSSFAELNYSGYVTELSNILVIDQASISIKQGAGAALRNSLASKDIQVREKLYARWRALDQPTKSHVKQQCINALSSSIPEAGRVAANVLAYIAFIELPFSECQDLIPTLLEATADTSNVNKRAASLNVIGLIAEQIEPDLIRAHNNSILTAVVQAIRKDEPNEQVRIAAIKALYNALGGISENFSHEGERNYIMQVVCEATAEQSLLVQIEAFRVLCKIMDLYYEYMDLYMKQALFGLTVQGMRNPKEEIAMQAFEFWLTVCQKELELTEDALEAAQYGVAVEHESRHYAKAALSEILPVLLDFLDKQADDPDMQENNVAEAAALCLQLFARAVGDDVVAPIIPFVERNIKAPHWRQREAAVMAFGSIIEGPDPTVLSRLVEQALPTLIAMISDSEIQVKHTTVWALSKITLNLPDTIHPTTHLPQLLEAIVKGLEDEPKIIVQCCVCLSNLAVESGEAIRPFYESLIVTLTRVAKRADNEEFCRNAAYEALSALVQTSSESSFQVTGNLAVEMLNRMEELLAVKSQLLGMNDVNDWDELQTNLVNVITKIANRMDAAIRPLADRIMTIILQLLQSAGKLSTVLESAFVTIGAMASAVGKEFENYMKAFEPFLLAALRTPQEHQLCVVATSVVGDISRALEEAFESYCPQIVPILFENLAAPSIHRSVKPPIFSAFGDIALAIGSKYEIYLAHTMQVLTQVAVMRIEESTPLELVDFIRELRESILDFYVGLVTGFKADSKIQSIQPYLADCFSFLELVSNDEAERSNSATTSAICILGDIADSFPNGELKPVLLQEWVERLLKSGKRPGMSEIAKSSTKFARRAVIAATR